MKFLFITAIILCLQGEAVQHILIDQFGYRPNDSKFAVIKNPKIGFDADSTFIPGSLYNVINVETNVSVFEGPISVFNDGEVDEASGDQIWHFDFSRVVEPGRYYILDSNNNATSYPFSINGDVYSQVLKQAVRMFYYQRSGFEKEARFAGEDWADKASHVGPGQDTEATLYNRKDVPETARDLHGGWYDAGDYNKYTPWTANYITTMMEVYLENPAVWDDANNIPESGNGVPDILDEARWGLDFLLRMVEPDGSVLCIVGEDGASPPSATKGPSYYGPATSTATYTAAKAFAVSSKVFRAVGDAEYAERLQFAAIRAWSWAEANPDVIFHNNNADYDSSGLGAGDQEDDTDYRRLSNRLAAALKLYELTGDTGILAVFEDNYKNVPLIMWSSYVSQYWAEDQYMFLNYLKLDGVSETHKATIRAALSAGFSKDGDYGGKIGKSGYRAFVDGYNWGSNQHISNMGAQFYLFSKQSVDPANDERYRNAAADYLHYIHGVNPFGHVYLTNMNKYGATKSLLSIYHTWYNYDSAVWGKTTDTTPGPPPGYVPGGANQYYTIDGCCPDGCGSTDNNARCNAEPVPVDEPPAKMYKDFNYNWPLNSWAISEPSCGYQLAYIRLLSLFVSAPASTSTSAPAPAHAPAPAPVPAPGSSSSFMPVSEE